MNNTHRLDQLADGLFAIIMTLLAFEIKPPVISGVVTDINLWNALKAMSGSFLIFFVTFALLFTYWRAHNFIVSTYAKGITAGLINYNVLFFFLVTLIPFSSRFLGDYYSFQIPILLYGLNVILIGYTLYLMRRYIEKNPVIDTIPVGRDEYVGGYIRILLPLFSAIAAIVISYWSPPASLLLFSAAIVFNLIPGTTRWMHKYGRIGAQE